MRILADGKYSSAFDDVASSRENYDVVALTVPSDGVPFSLTAPTEFIHHGLDLSPTNRISWNTKSDTAAVTNTRADSGKTFIHFNHYYTAESCLSRFVVAQGL